MLTSGELAELYAAHQILKDANEYLRAMHMVTTIDAELILMDARATVQQDIVDRLYGQGDGTR